MLTVELDKRTVLIVSLVVFVAANLVLVLSGDYAVVIVARFVAGAFVAGMAIVPPERVGRTIAIIISGVTVSAAMGVPLGTLAGRTFGWRGSFTAIIVLCALALVATSALVPSVAGSGKTGAAGQAKYAFAPRVLFQLLLNITVFASLVVALAGPGAGLASSLPASAVNVGIAAGSAAGGLALGGFGPSAPILTAAVIAGVGVLIAWATSHLKPPVVEETTEPAARSS